MRISDWSSDVCSSDLHLGIIVRRQDRRRPGRVEPDRRRDLGEHAMVAHVAIVGEMRAEQRELEVRLHPGRARLRSEEHTSELQSLMRISYAVFCLKKNKNTKPTHLNSLPQDTISQP